ncbi:MAG TPA: beta-eliminating lyase-related protein, partial [Bacteroidota bacterium]|nr:beta-eliminating lyase-related protein [Bacteroidota bacterium]
QMIERAHKWRKVFGGGMRQAGIIAAGALYALNHNVERLADDHRKARLFAEKVSTSPRVSIDLEAVQTNIVIVETGKTGKSPDEIIGALKAEHVLVSLGSYTSIRAVMHLDVSEEQVRRAADVFLNLLA